MLYTHKDLVHFGGSPDSVLVRSLFLLINWPLESMVFRTNSFAEDLQTNCAKLSAEYPFARRLNSMARQAAADRAWFAVSRFYDNCKNSKPGKKGYSQFQHNNRSVEYKTSEWKLDPDGRHITFTMTIIARNELYNYDGSLSSLTGEQYRDALISSYTSNIATTISFTDPKNTSISVYFTDYNETIIDLKSQIIPLSVGNTVAPSYECTIELLEA
jgi:transposase